jgi:hypothetical protein
MSHVVFLVITGTHLTYMTNMTYLAKNTSFASIAELIEQVAENISIFF